MKKNNIYRIYANYRKKRIKNNDVYIFSHNGTDFAGNMYRISECLLKKYGPKRLFISLQKPQNEPVNLILLKRQFPYAKIFIVAANSVEDYMALATCKYLFTDNNMPVPFHKRDHQILIQTWHGTPLKRLGYDNHEDVTFVGKTRRAFTTADYILFPNEYTAKNMIRSFRMNHELCIKNTIVYEGYSRNSPFFKEEQDYIALKSKLGVDKKKVFVYMPTWRGAINQASKVAKPVMELEEQLEELDGLLSDELVVYAKLHRLDSAIINFTKFDHIFPFPDNYEVYDVLAIADCLITDYSSVMFDFLSTGKKIVLYVYDKYEYINYPGMYFDLDELPFPQVDTPGSLYAEMVSDKKYDDTDAIRQFCNYDDKYSTERFLNLIFNQHGEKSKTVDIASDAKKNILLYSGALNSDVATMNFYKYIDSLDLNAANYYYLYLNSNFIQNPIKLQGIPAEMDIASIDKFHDQTLFCPNETMNEKDYKDAFTRLFPNITFDKIIRFGGMDEDTLFLLGHAPVAKKIILYYDTMENHPVFAQFRRNMIKSNCVFFDIPKKIQLENPYECEHMVNKNASGLSMECLDFPILSESRKSDDVYKRVLTSPQRIATKAKKTEDYVTQIRLKTALKENEILKAQRDDYYNAYRRIEDSTAWKVTFLLRKMTDYIKYLRRK